MNRQADWEKELDADIELQERNKRLYGGNWYEKYAEQKSTLKYCKKCGGYFSKHKHTFNPKTQQHEIIWKGTSSKVGYNPG